MDHLVMQLEGTLYNPCLADDSNSFHRSLRMQYTDNYENQSDQENMDEQEEKREQPEDLDPNISQLEKYKIQVQNEGGKSTQMITQVGPRHFKHGSSMFKSPPRREVMELEYGEEEQTIPKSTSFTAGPATNFMVCLLKQLADSKFQGSSNDKQYLKEVLRQTENQKSQQYLYRLCGFQKNQQFGSTNSKEVYKAKHFREACCKRLNCINILHRIFGGRQQREATLTLLGCLQTMYYLPVDPHVAFSFQENIRLSMQME